MDLTPATASYAFTSTSFEGGGFQNVVAVSSTGAVLTGADISGIERTAGTAQGNSQFFAQNTGLCTTAGACGNWAQQVATLVNGPAAMEFYAGTGQDGTSGGVYHSTDDGATWTQLCTSGETCPMFSGNHTDSPAAGVQLPLDHPRMTGNLIAIGKQLTGPRALFAAATANPTPSPSQPAVSGGLMRSVDSGATWTVLGLSSNATMNVFHFLRGVAYNAAADTLYVADYANGVWQLTSASTCTVGVVGGCTLTSITAPASAAAKLRYVEELAWIDDTLYAAAGYAGVYAFDPTSPPASAWTALDTGLFGICDMPSSPATTCTASANGGVTGSIYMSIAGYVRSGRTILFAGAVPSPNAPAALYVSAPAAGGAASWQPIGATEGPGTDMFSFDVIGPTDDPWWLGNTTYGVQSFWPNGNGYVASFIAIDPSHRNAVYVAGRSGVWASSNCGIDDNFACSFAPLVHAMNVTGVHGFAVDTLADNGQYHAMIGDHDFGFMWSTDEFTTSIGRLAPGQGPGMVHTQVYDTALDPLNADGSGPAGTTSTVFAAIGGIDYTTYGDIFTSSDPTSGVAWQPFDLATETGYCNTPVTQIAVGHPRSLGGARVVVAAQNACGLWRCTGAGAGQCAFAKGGAYTVASVDPGQGQFLWPNPLTATVYFYDPTFGLYKSTDSGHGWTLVWSVTSNVEHHTGWLAADPTGTYIYAAVWGQSTCGTSDCTGIWRLTQNANDPLGPVSATLIAGPTTADGANLTTPGPIALDSAGRLWTTDFDVKLVPHIGYWTTPAGAAPLGAYTPVDDAVYHGTSLTPTGLTVAADGKVFVEQAHNGLLRGDPQ